MLNKYASSMVLRKNFNKYENFYNSLTSGSYKKKKNNKIFDFIGCLNNDIIDSHGILNFEYLTKDNNLELLSPGLNNIFLTLKKNIYDLGKVKKVEGVEMRQKLKNYYKFKKTLIIKKTKLKSTCTCVVFRKIQSKFNKKIICKNYANKNFKVETKICNISTTKYDNIFIINYAANKKLENNKCFIQITDTLFFFLNLCFSKNYEMIKNTYSKKYLFLNKDGGINEAEIHKEAILDIFINTFNNVNYRLGSHVNIFLLKKNKFFKKLFFLIAKKNTEYLNFMLTSGIKSLRPLSLIRKKVDSSVLIMSFFLTKNKFFLNHKKKILPSAIFFKTKKSDNKQDIFRFSRAFFFFKKSSYLIIKCTMLMKFILISEKSYIDSYLNNLFRAFSKNIKNSIIKTEKINLTLKIPRDDLYKKKTKFEEYKKKNLTN